MTNTAGGRARLLLAGVLALPLASLSQGEGGAAEAREAIRTADAAFCDALRARDRARFAALVAEDARFFTAGEPSGTREDVVRDWEIFFADDGPRLTWAPVHVEAAASGDLGYSTGRYEWGGKSADGTPRISTGWYVTIWRKGSDGRWRAALDIGTPPSPKRP